MSAHILGTVPWRIFLREKKRYINNSSSNCHHVVLQEHRPSPGNILCHAGSPPCSWCLLEGCYATPSLGNPSLPHWRTHSSSLLLLLFGEFQVTVTSTKLNPAHASYINWMYFILIYGIDWGIVVWLPAGARDLPLLQNYTLAAGITQSPVHWILRFISLEQVWSTFYVVRATSANFGLHVDNVKFNTGKEEWLSIQGVPGFKVSTLGFNSRADAESKTTYTHGPNSQRFRIYEFLKYDK